MSGLEMEWVYWSAKQKCKVVVRTNDRVSQLADVTWCWQRNNSVELLNTMLHTCVFVWRPCEHVQCPEDTSSWTPSCRQETQQWTDTQAARCCIANMSCTRHLS